MRGWLQRFMYGRYGYDQLNWFLLILYPILYLLSVLTRIGLFNTIGTVGIVLAAFRILSRNFAKRRAENARFMQAASPVIRWWKLRSAMHRDKDHRYFKCPNCSQQLRVPKGKGKISITCRSCGLLCDMFMSICMGSPPPRSMCMICIGLIIRYPLLSSGAAQAVPLPP